MCLEKEFHRHKYIYNMPLGDLVTTHRTFSQHDFSRSNQLRILSMSNAVPEYVRNEWLYSPAGLNGAVYISSATLPGRTLKDLPVTIQGFDFHSPGQVAYDQPNPWALTAKVPSDFLGYNSLVRWQFDIANEATTCGAPRFTCPDATIDVAILGPDCTIQRVVRLIGVWPTSIGAITYNNESIDAVTFDFAFYYTRWEPVEVTDTGAIDFNPGSNIDGILQSYESSILANSSRSCAVKP